MTKTFRVIVVFGVLICAAAAQADPCTDGPDHTVIVQAAMNVGLCLPPGTYNIDTPPLGPSGRRRDAMLSGGILCGVRDDVTIMYRGSVNAQAWLGINNPRSIHNVTLKTRCLTDTVEQNHVVRITTDGVDIHDVKIDHPTRFPAIAGDDINVLAIDVNSPIVGPVINHVQFQSCARFGVQITRGVHGASISNSRFSGDCAIGSEGAGNIVGLTLDHLEFEAPSPAGHVPALNLQNVSDLLVDHVAVHGRSVLFYMCDHVTFQHSSVDGLVVTNPNADWASAWSISTTGSNITAVDVRLVQMTAAAVPVVSIGPVRSNYQAALSSVSILFSDLVQGTSAPVISAQGIDGLTLSNSTLTLALPSVPIVAVPSVATAPAVSMPSLNIVQTGNTLIALP